MNDRWLVPGVCIFLAAIVWVVFGQTLHHEFVNFDDEVYVYENPLVQKGLTWEGFRWAFTYGQIGNWHPLTWISHMLDCQLYGLNAGGHHLTNVLLHTISVILLFLVLRHMTGFLWRSAFVAAVFAIHPLRVESVAWVAERKDVLSGLFFMLTLWAYVRYAQGVTSDAWQVTRTSSRTCHTVSHPPRVTYLLFGGVVFCVGIDVQDHAGNAAVCPAAAGLLAAEPGSKLYAPGFVPAGGREDPAVCVDGWSCVATALFPRKCYRSAAVLAAAGKRRGVLCHLPLADGLSIGTGVCLSQPRKRLPFWQVAGALGLLLAISGWYGIRQTRPYLFTGWFWYMGMMIPVIGIVQISYYAHADRYTYLPQIGLYLLLTWVAAELCAGWRCRRVVLGGLSTVILAALIFCARAQTSHWRNSESLWTHTLACTSGNYTAHNNLGDALFQKGRVDEAITQYQSALQIEPDYSFACYNLGNALFKKGRVDEAIAQYQTALQIKPGYAEAHDNLGNVLLQKGRVDEAIIHFQKALQVNTR